MYICQRVSKGSKYSQNDFFFLIQNYIFLQKVKNAFKKKEKSFFSQKTLSWLKKQEVLSHSQEKRYVYLSSDAEVFLGYSW